MIQEVEIINFQLHKKIKLEFHPGVNVIKGITGSGKSGIIRAIKWSLQNRPSGFAFKPTFAKKKDNTSVSLKFGNGKIIREKGKANIYQINGGKPLEAIKTDVPEAVQKITNMTEINLQSQHDPYFLLQDSPGEVARKLNAVAGLDIIDECIKEANRKYSSKLLEITKIKEEKKNLETELKDYTFIDNAEKLINEIDPLNEEQTKIEGKILSISELLGDLSIVEGILKDFAFVDNAEELINKIYYLNERHRRITDEIFNIMKTVEDLEIIEKEVNKYNSIINLEPNIEEIDSLLNKYFEIESRENSINEIVNHLNEIEKDIPSIDISDIENRIKKIYLFQKIYLSYVNKTEEISNILQQFSIEKIKIIELNTKQKTKENELKELFSTLKICPLCGSELNI